MCSLILVVMSLILCDGLVRAQDIVLLAPDKVKVAFEDDFVRILEVITLPGDTLPFHTHPEYILYAITEGNLAQWHRGEEPRTIEMKPGTSAHRPAESEGHSATNVGGAILRTLNIELKNNPSWPQTQLMGK